MDSKGLKRLKKLRDITHGKKWYYKLHPVYLGSWLMGMQKSRTEIDSVIKVCESIERKLYGH